MVIEYYEAGGFEKTQQAYGLAAIVNCKIPAGQPPVRVYVVPVQQKGLFSSGGTNYRVCIGTQPQGKIVKTTVEAYTLAHRYAVITLRALVGGYWKAANFAGTLGPDNGSLRCTIGYYGTKVQDDRLPDATYVARISYPQESLPHGAKREYFVFAVGVIKEGRKRWYVNVSDFVTQLPPSNTEREAIEIAMLSSPAFSVFIRNYLMFEAMGRVPNLAGNDILRRPS